MWRRSHETNAELLFEHFTWQIGVQHVNCVMLVPLFGNISGYVVHENDQGN